MGCCAGGKKRSKTKVARGSSVPRAGKRSIRRKSTRRGHRRR